MNGKQKALVCVGVLALVVTSARADADMGWPREFDVPEGKIVTYQPQADVLDGNLLTGRAAISVTPKGKTAPIFGAAWFEAQVDIDRDQRLVRVISLKVPKVRFGESTPEQEKQLQAVLEREVPKTDLTMSLDRLLAGLKVAQNERDRAEGLNTEPPKIYFETKPAVLIVLEGDPIVRPIEGAKAQRVVNTPYFMAFDPATKLYWLKAGPSWFSTADAKGAWKATAAPSGEIVAMQAKAEEAQKQNQPVLDESTLTSQQLEQLQARKNDQRVPKIIVSTVPAELVVTDGEPQFKPLVGSDLLEMSNTDSSVFMETGGQLYYVVLSGRWYASETMNGPWTYVRSDKLPASFAKISPGSDRAEVRTFVAGTDEADDALIDAQVPQTTAVVRSEAKLTVTYDGEPKFEPIPNTSIRYAVNTDTSVLHMEGKYYACKDAVWFVAVSPTGPWALADSVPNEVRKIPPESPVYNVKYVYVYDSTPQVVYVGYLPGYMGCYPYYGSVVYGTGYYYRPWVGPVYYYPRPVTYGFRVNYNPWTGWSFGIGMSFGWGTVTVGWGGYPGYYGGWWGPAGFYPRPPYYGGHPGYRPGYPGHRPGYPGYRPPPAYRPPPGGARPTPMPAQRPTTPSNKLPNNVYTDKNGNVYKRDNSGNWSERDKGAWKPAPGSTPSAKPSPSQAKPQQRPSAPTQQLNKDYQARQYGSQRAQSYQQGAGGGANRPSTQRAAPRKK